MVDDGGEDDLLGAESGEEEGEGPTVSATEVAKAAIPSYYKPGTDPEKSAPSFLDQVPILLLLYVAAAAVSVATNVTAAAIAAAAVHVSDYGAAVCKSKCVPCVHRCCACDLVGVSNQQQRCEASLSASVVHLVNAGRLQTAVCMAGSNVPTQVRYMCPGSRAT